MKNRAVTQWFPCSEKPVNPGEYEYRLKSGVPFGRVYFTGIRFSSMNAYMDDGDFLLNTEPQHYEWRGLAEKP